MTSSVSTKYILYLNFSAVCLSVCPSICLFPAESDAFSDGQTQRGMDRYLDSLFDPVLSDSSVVSAENCVSVFLSHCIISL